MANRRASIRMAMLAGAALGATGLGTIEARAGGFFLHEQSAYFQGLSMAGAAAGGPSISAMFWNPATITQSGLGMTSEIDFAGVAPRSEIHPISATAANGASLLGLGPSGNIGTDAAIPSSYLTYGLNNWLWFGLGFNSPFGLRTMPSPLWAGMFYSQESEVKSYSANPDVAIKITDWLSIGVGAQIQYMKIKLHSAFPGSGPAVTLSDPLRIDGDTNTFDFGFTAGLTITPTPWTTIGLGYRSRIDQAIEGDIFRPAFLIPPPPALIGVPAAFVNFKATVPLPDIGTASIRQKITETFTLLGTVEWQNWSRLGTIPVATFPAGPILGVPTALPFQWRDGWLFSGGAEWQWLPRLALRGGVAFERSPITDQVRGTRLPDDDRVWLSVGATLKYNEQLSFDVGYSHIFMKDAPIGIVPGNPLFNPALGTFIGTAQTNIDILSVSLRYRWAAPPPPAPLITKG